MNYKMNNISGPGTSSIQPTTAKDMQGSFSTFKTAAIQKEAYSNLRKQTSRMTSRSDSKFPAITVGVNVMIRILDVDKSKTDLPNIMGIVLEKTEHDLYRIGTENGILDKLYYRLI